MFFGQVQSDLEHLTNLFELDADGYADELGVVLKEAWAVFVAGLLLDRFKRSKDKRELRNKVVKDLAILKDKGISRDLLPQTLRTRAERVVSFAIGV